MTQIMTAYLTQLMTQFFSFFREILPKKNSKNLLGLTSPSLVRNCRRRHYRPSAIAVAVTVHVALSTNTYRRRRHRRVSAIAVAITVHDALGTHTYVVLTALRCQDSNTQPATST